MNHAGLHAVLHRLRKETGQAADLTDAQLLERFIANREAAAFAALLQRHGRMVLGVCQRIVGNLHDAEDAFQATFLVLARKADSVRPRAKVGNWLFGVARTTARRARALNAKRRMREQQVRAAAPPDLAELRLVLDQELARLSERHREVILLCDLEGRTRQEVARQLKIPEGTVASRLSKARNLLGQRLARHGLPVSAGVLVGLLGAEPAAAMVMATARAAVRFAAGASATGLVTPNVLTLTEGVLGMMATNKLKPLFAVLLILAIGLGTVAYQVSGQESYGRDDLQQARAEIKRLQAENAALVKRLEGKQADKDKLVVKVYPVGASDPEELEDLDDILEMVLGPNLGDSNAKFYRAGQCVVLRLPMTVHEQVRAVLDDIRKAKADVQKKAEGSSK